MTLTFVTLFTYSYIRIECCFYTFLFFVFLLLWSQCFPFCTRQQQQQQQNTSSLSREKWSVASGLVSCAAEIDSTIEMRVLRQGVHSSKAYQVKRRSLLFLHKHAEWYRWEQTRKLTFVVKCTYTNRGVATNFRIAGTISGVSGSHPPSFYLSSDLSHFNFENIGKSKKMLYI